MKYSNFTILVLIFWSSHCLSQDYNAVQITSEKVRANIYVLYGAGGNIGVLKKDNSFLIVDDQFAPLSGKIKTALNEIGEGEIEFVINTHFHYDHADGNKAFGPEGTTIVAHENTRKRLGQDNLIQVPGFDTLVQEKYPVEAMPDISFESELKIYLKDDPVQIFHVKNAHTDTDAIVYFEQSNVFHTGDVFVRYGIPFIDAPNGGSVSGLINAVNSLIEKCNDHTIIIPGHGQLSKKHDLISFRDMLQLIWDRVAEQAKDGKNLSEIIDSRPARGFSGEENADYIIILIFNELN